MLKIFWNLLSDICQLPHFHEQLNLQISEMNIMLTVGPNLVNIYLQIIIIGEKTQFELNQSHLNSHPCLGQPLWGLPGLGWDYFIMV